MKEHVNTRHQFLCLQFHIFFFLYYSIAVFFGKALQREFICLYCLFRLNFVCVFVFKLLYNCIVEIRFQISGGILLTR